MNAILSEQLNGDWVLMDQDEDAPLMRISFHNEFKALDFEKKKAVALKAFEELAQQAGRDIVRPK